MPVSRIAGRAPALLLALLLSSPCGAQLDPGPDDWFRYQPRPGENEPWQEGSFRLPAYPAVDDLKPVDLGAGGWTVSLRVDLNSVHIGEDKVVRLSYALESVSGALNVFYEGFRCDANRYRTYAIGAGDGTWRRLPDSAWKTIPSITHNAARQELLNTFFCPPGSVPRGEREIRASLRRSTGFDSNY
ncbi:MAG: CNP1-like family protein [Gammaproteobacteria bacterium]|nr:CNP1-like family protein [Gammaproteobacteria bacterium]